MNEWMQLKSIIEEKKIIKKRELVASIYSNN